MRATSRLFALLTALTLVVGGLAVSPAAPAAASAADDRLAVVVVGDGSTSGNQAVPVAIQLMDGEGAAGSRIDMPTAADGDQHAFTLGADRDQQGALQQSADRRFVTLGGYDHEPDSTSLNGTTAPEVLRVVGRVAADGGVDTSTTLDDAYSTRHIRGVTSVDGSRFWTGGHGHDAPVTRGGVLSIPLAGDAPTPITAGSSNVNNTRVPVIHDAQLYVSSDRSGFHGVNRVGEGLPTDAAAMTLVAAAPTGSEVPHDFAFIGDHLYVTYTEGDAGIVKYARDGASWEPVGLHPGAFWGVTGRVAGDDVVLYATRGASQGNEVMRLVDTGDETEMDATEVTISIAPAGTAGSATPCPRCSAPPATRWLGARSPTRPERASPRPPPPVISRWPTFDEPVAEFDMSEHIEPFQAGQTHDFEGSARQGDTLYWVGSLGNTRSGNVRLDRDIVVATEVDGSGADASLTYAGHAHTAADPVTDAPAVTPGSDPVGAGTGGSGDSGSQGPLPRTGIGWIQTAVATGLLALSAGWALRRRALLA